MNSEQFIHQAESNYSAVKRKNMSNTQIWHIFAATSLAANSPNVLLIWKNTSFQSMAASVGTAGDEASSHESNYVIAHTESEIPVMQELLSNL